MFKLDKNKPHHVHALVVMLCQYQIINDVPMPTSALMRHTGRSRKWCIQFMRELEAKGRIKIVEHRHRPNRTGFAYRVSSRWMNLYNDKFFHAGYNKFVAEKANYLKHSVEDWMSA